MKSSFSLKVISWFKLKLCETQRFISVTLRENDSFIKLLKQDCDRSLFLADFRGVCR
jgi:hypothetical protein